MLATYAIACYLLFLATVALLFGFLVGVGPLVIDSGSGLPTPAAIAVDLGLVALFGLQHGVMARPRFKAWFGRVLPAGAERSTFVLASSLLLILTAFAWQPLPQEIWSAGSAGVRLALNAIALAGWIFLVGATFPIDHFAQFGLRPAVLKARPQDGTFRTPLLYRYVRHPQMLGFLFVFWVTPSLTLGRLLLAIGMTIYIFIGVAYEERDLIANFGDAYRDYRKRVPAVFPLPFE
jgi:protein-S-isoprenylcysteine O-methyltransferase Ste14